MTQLTTPDKYDDICKDENNLDDNDGFDYIADFDDFDDNDEIENGHDKECYSC